MDGEKLIKKWIDEKRTYVSENEIREYGLLGRIALLILQENYEAKYVPSDDGHFCGGYSFRNPLGHYEKRYGLYYMFPKGQLTKLMQSKSYDGAIKEIVRLEYDDIYWHHKEQIAEYIEMIKTEIYEDMYHHTRYWFIWEEEAWVV